MTASDYSLQQQLNCGQSYWLDNLTRRMISSGELSVWIRNGGLRGITADPTTFHDALNSQDYDQSSTSMFHDGCSTDHVLDALLVQDVQ